MNQEKQQSWELTRELDRRAIPLIYAGLDIAAAYKLALQNRNSVPKTEQKRG